MSLNELQAKVQVKQRLWSKMAFKTVLLLGKCNLISLEKAVSISNYILQKGAFKFRVDKGKWRLLDNAGKIVVEE